MSKEEDRPLWGIDDSLDRAERIVQDGYTEEKWSSLENALLSFGRPPGYPPHPGPATDAQFSRFIDIGVALLEQGYPELGRDIPTLQLFGGILKVCGFVWETDSPFPETEYITRRFIEPLLRPNEVVVQVEWGGCELGGFNRLRSGHILVTTERVLVVGNDIIASTKVAERYYLLYPDIEEKAYYGSLDYLPLEHVEEMELKWGLARKYIQMKLRDIESAKISPRHFYGPLFFKFQLSDKVKEKRGDFQIKIRLGELASKRAQDLKKRHETLAEKIRNLAESSKSGRISPQPQ
ncbi:MAG: hypothetical protein ACE5H4_06360 [Candidatus Thorarchaeota archaeon]